MSGLPKLNPVENIPSAVSQRSRRAADPLTNSRGWLGMLLAVICVWVVGCGRSTAEPESPSVVEDAPSAPSPVALTVDGTPEISIATLRQKLGANQNAKFEKAGGRVVAASLMNAGVTDLAPLAGLPLKYLDLTHLQVSDLTPLAGMPLEELYLEGTRVADLSPLAGMPLRILRMEHTPVTDLTPLQGLPLQQLNLFDTGVTEISVVAEMPLETLWITETEVRDLRPIATVALVSLDLEKTPVTDLTVLSGKTSLKRLNVAGSAVSDFTPLAGLSLERLIFTPESITTGLDIVRGMSSIQQIGRSFDTVSSPAEFWARFDAADSPAEPPATDSPTPPAPNTPE